jgi:hypothetical protein
MAVVNTYEYLRKLMKERNAQFIDGTIVAVSGVLVDVRVAGSSQVVRGIPIADHIRATAADRLAPGMKCSMGVWQTQPYVVALLYAGGDAYVPAIAELQIPNIQVKAQVDGYHVKWWLARTVGVREYVLWGNDTKNGENPHELYRGLDLSYVEPYGTGYVWFAVQAIGNDGTAGPLSAWVTDEPVITAPQNVTLTMLQDGYEASWDAVSGATGYMLERSTDGQEYTEIVGPFPSRTVLLPFKESPSNGGLHTIRVAALSVTGSQGDWSEYVSHTSLPPAPTMEGLVQNWAFTTGAEGWTWTTNGSPPADGEWATDDGEYLGAMVYGGAGIWVKWESPALSELISTASELHYKSRQRGFPSAQVNLTVEIVTDSGTYTVDGFLLSGETPWEERIIGLSSYAGDTLQTIRFTWQIPSSYTAWGELDDIELHGSTGAGHKYASDGHELTWTQDSPELVKEWNVYSDADGTAGGETLLATVTEPHYTVPYSVADEYFVIEAVQWNGRTSSDDARTGPWPASQAVTISDDAITRTREYHVVSAESGTSDNLATINGGSVGDLLVIQPADGHTLTVQDGVDNIVTETGNDIVLNGSEDHLLLVLANDGNWYTVGAGGGGGGFPFSAISVDLSNPDADYSSLNTAFSTEGAGKVFVLGPGTHNVTTAAPQNTKIFGFASDDQNVIAGYSSSSLKTVRFSTGTYNTITIARLQNVVGSGSDDAAGVQLNGTAASDKLTLVQSYVVAFSANSNAYGIDVAGTAGKVHLIGGRVYATASNGTAYGARVASGTELRLYNCPIIGLSGSSTTFFTGSGTVHGIFQDDAGNLYSIDGAPGTEALVGAGGAWPLSDIKTFDTAGGADYSSLATAFSSMSDGQALQLNAETISQSNLFINKSLGLLGAGVHKTYIQSSGSGNNWNVLSLWGASKIQHIREITFNHNNSSAADNTAAIESGSNDSFSAFIENCNLDATGAATSLRAHGFRSYGASGTKSFEFKHCYFRGNGGSGAYGISVTGTDTVFISIDGGIVGDAILINNPNASLTLRGLPQINGTITLTSYAFASGLYIDGNGYIQDLSAGNANFGTTRRVGSIYQASYKDIFPMGDMRGLARRFSYAINDVHTWDCRGAPPAAYSWQGTPFLGTPANLTYGLHGEYLQAFQSTASAAFLARTGTAALGMQMFMRGWAMHVGGIGVRIDDGTTANYAEAYLETAGAGIAKMTLRDSVAGSVSSATFLVTLNTVVFFYCYAPSPPNWTPLSYFISEPGGQINVLAGGTMTWAPVRHGIYFPNNSSYIFGYLDWYDCTVG